MDLTNEPPEAISVELSSNLRWIDEVLTCGICPDGLPTDRLAAAAIEAGMLGWFCANPKSQIKNEVISTLLKLAEVGEIDQIALLSGLSALRNGAMTRARLIRVFVECELLMSGLPDEPLSSKQQSYDALRTSIRAHFREDELAMVRYEVNQRIRMARQAAIEKARQEELRRIEEDSRRAAEANRAAELQLRSAQREAEDRLQAELRSLTAARNRAIGEAYERTRRLLKFEDVVKYAVKLSDLEIDDDDIRLVIRWMNCAEPLPEEMRAWGCVPNSLTNWFFKAFALDENANRLLAARLAEKSALLFFSGTGSTVEDVSKEQLTLDSNRWQTHDIAVNGHPFDVKHARAARSDSNGYTEHCVAKFKQERDVPVEIMGVFSGMVPTEELKFPKLATEDVRFLTLGRTSEESLKRVSAVVSEYSDIPVRITRIRGGKSFLPCWCFETRARVQYVPSPETQDQLESDLALLRSDRYQQFSADAFSVIAGVPLPDISTPAVSERYRRFAATLASVKIGHQITLPLAYLLVLTEILESVRQDQPSLQHIRDLIYLGSDDRTWSPSRWPLGAWDPLCSVGGLLAAFDKAIQQNATWLKQFKEYRLVGLNILHGLNSEGQWVTVMAYCGGRRQQAIFVRFAPDEGGDPAQGAPIPLVREDRVYALRQKEKCQETPLVLGSSELCECGKLICPTCGFCMERCPHCAERQLDAALRVETPIPNDRESAYDDDIPF